MILRARTGLVFLCISLIVFQTTVFAEPDSRLSYYRYKDDPYVPRGVLLSPIVSGIVPGFDQWIEGQFGQAIWYTSLGVGGLLISQVAQSNLDRRYKNFGLSLYFTAGSLSLYQAFRSSTNSRKGLNEFRFLTKEETPNDFMGSAFKFSYLGYWTTLFPLVSGMALYFLLDTKRGSGTPAEFGDLFYAGTMSYMTGISEELFFRGYLMPVIYHYTGNDVLALLASSVAYGAAHGLRFNHFVTAFLFGFYSGWIVQKQEWQLGEMIFVHTWLDVMAFLADFAAHREPSYLSIPLIQMTF